VGTAAGNINWGGKPKQTDPNSFNTWSSITGGTEQDFEAWKKGKSNWQEILTNYGK
jgi:hypothetical protein